MYLRDAYSNKPRKTLVTQRPAKFCTNPVHITTTPQTKTIVPIKTDGRLNLSRIMLLGISASRSVDVSTTREQAAHQQEYMGRRRSLVQYYIVFQSYGDPLVSPRFWHCLFWSECLIVILTGCHIPMLARSMNEIKYKMSSIGTSLQSTLRRTRFRCSSVNPAKNSASAAEMCSF
jgi:hypothetical protein